MNLFKAFIIFAPMVSSVAGAVQAQQGPVTLKQIGATFQEAPPGREKNLVPFFLSGGQEKVETHVVVTLKDRVFANLPFWGSDAKLVATGIFTDKTSVPLGDVEISNIRKISDDGKKTLLSLSISRLPDREVSAVGFSGTVSLPVAKGLITKTARFDGKAGPRLGLGLATVKVEKVEANSIMLSGGGELDRLVALKLVRNDGTALDGKSAMRGRMGSTVHSEWSFNAAVGAGKVEALIYEGLDSVTVPINLVVAKPY